MLTELGRRLTDKWLTLLTLPGALFLAVAAGALVLGRDHTWDAAHLVHRITAWAEDPRVDTVGGQVVVFAAVIATATLVGLLADGLGTALERVWLAADWRSWPRPARLLARWRVRARHRRWSRAHERLRAALAEGGGDRETDADAEPAEITVAEPSDAPEAEPAATAGNTDAAHSVPAGTAVAGPSGPSDATDAEPADPEDGRPSFDEAYDRLVRIAPEEPDRPTWCGDRLHAVAVRFRREHALELAVVWPHLWLMLPDGVCEQIRAARQDLARAFVLGAWSLVHLPLVLWWYPAVIVAAVLAAVAWWRVRSAVETYAVLLEAAVRLHVADLAAQVGVEYTGPLSPAAGRALTLRLHAGVPPRPRD
ncbi:hypothetical protein PWG71_05770 [Nocardiopsis sp. N85]|uniref:hypothetical protein n=1 Tax=Nocardiopsis sp. N85 TaxID=3029400 RepID=UPI00237F88BD|nr:hypothetical protein [Nocardiopsis sp. N85]MDE3720888.1 hypothetical protein [Nocardiopsis sp. N85]